MLRGRWTAPIAVALAGALALIAAVALRGPGARASTQVVSQTQGPTLDVTGHGSVLVAPDQANINLGVMIRASTAQAALSADSRRMQAVVAALKADGLPATAIQTSNLSVGPVYAPGRTPKITGFQASNTVDVTLKDLTQVGKVVDDALHAGANRVDGIGFSVSNPSVPQQQAYQAAWRDAQAQAQAIAKASGETITGIRSITANTSGGRPVPFAAAASMAAAAPTPVLAGQQTVSVQLDVVYDIGR